MYKSIEYLKITQVIALKKNLILKFIIKLYLIYSIDFLYLLIELD